MRSFFVICMVCLFSVNLAAKEFRFTLDEAWGTLQSDYANFYQKDRLWRAAKVYAVGGIMANSNIDTQFQSWHQDNVVSDTSIDIARVSKLLGEKSILVPIAVASASLQLVDKNSATGSWGEKTMRAYLVGGPAMYAVPLLTGASRPKDKYQDADWRPFNDNNGVSGHAFVGAVPFITLAQMDNLKPWQKNLAYFASGLSAWSRIHDDAHYLSQAMLGWYMAWESVNSVNQDNIGSWYHVSPYSFQDGLGLSITVQW